jgi:hypothetical protein
MKTAKAHRNLSFKIVSIIFTLITAFYFIYQLILGNSFYEDVSPAVITGLFFLMGIAGIFISFRKS